MLDFIDIAPLFYKNLQMKSISCGGGGSGICLLKQDH